MACISFRESSDPHTKMKPRRGQPVALMIADTRTAEAFKAPKRNTPLRRGHAPHHLFFWTLTACCPVACDADMDLHEKKLESQRTSWRVPSVVERLMRLKLIKIADCDYPWRLQLIPPKTATQPKLVRETTNDMAHFKARALGEEPHSIPEASSSLRDL